MALPSGERLGPYEIVSKIGSGGMGEVYRARDTRLDRTVAIKILSAHLSSNADLKQRFEREARTISSLSHPNICALYDIGQQNGIDYLVMEFLEGEPLADRLSKGALPIEQVLRFGMQMADALDKAHRQGIVHRDLKPGNIMITRSGIKLLDFGLAKLQASAARQLLSGVSALATEQRDLTAEGTIIGTLQYMSPEQLEGRDTDARTDVFAMGIVLYEMVTGKHAFTGKSQASLIAAILSSEPQPISTIQPLVPAAFDRVVKTCLAKDPEDRWQTAHDVMIQLRWIEQATPDTGIPVPAVERRRRRDRLLWILLGAVLGALIAIAGVRSLMWQQPADPHTGTHFILTLPETDQLLFNRDEPFFSISPDGKSIVYSARRNNTTQLFLRSLDRFEPVPLAGTENASAPFYSPDGRWVAFHQESKIQRIPFSGGSPIAIADAYNFFGGNWTKDQKLILVPSWTANRLLSVPSTGGKPQELARPDPARKERELLWPEMLPNGKGVLLTAWTGNETSIAVQPLPSGERKTIIQSGTSPKYLSTGHILFAHGSALFVIPFDQKKFEVTGAAIPVLDGVAMLADSFYSAYSISSEGTLVYVPGKIQTKNFSLVWLDRSGKEVPVTDINRPLQQPRISPDGRRIAFIQTGLTYNVYILDLDRDSSTRLSFFGDEEDPLWTSDGKRIIYCSGKKGRNGLYWKPADGSSEEEPLLTNEFSLRPRSCSSDGKFLAYVQRNILKDASDIWILSLVGDHKTRPFANTDFDEDMPAFSRDSHWIAFVSNESGRNEVYIQAFPGPAGKIQISNQGGNSPSWSRDGRELFYWQDNKLTAVSIRTEPTFAASKPAFLFETSMQISAANHMNDIAPDGRFLSLKRSEVPSPIQMHVIIGWLDQLKTKISK